MKKEKQESKVFIINNSGHDYSAAEKYGQLVFLTSGIVNTYATNMHYREMVENLKDATPEDYILITSLASMNAIAGWIVGLLGFPLNLLLFKDNDYVVRNIHPRLLLEERKEVS